jgi:hypothetical protein
MVPAPDGSLARMQLSPYRVQLAGIQTAAVEYRPITFDVVTGGFVQPASTNTASVSVQADVYDKDLPLLSEGQRVEVSGDGWLGRAALTGRVQQLLPPGVNTRRPQLQVVIDNAPPELRPGVFVRVRIRVPPEHLGWLARALADDWRDRTMIQLAGRSLARPPGGILVLDPEPLLRMAGAQAQLQRGLVLTVLDSAVIDTGLKKVVYRESGPGLFEAVEVVLGPRCGEYRPVLQGLEAGQRVAAAGAILLDAETRLNPAVAAAYFGAARTAAPTPARSSDPGIADALARLAPADRALAARQKTCPVTGEPLGSMGTPVRVEVAGRTVFLCCRGCVADLQANPERYLSKLP